MFLLLNCVGAKHMQVFHYSPINAPFINMSAPVLHGNYCQSIDLILGQDQSDGSPAKHII